MSQRAHSGKKKVKSPFDHDDDQFAKDTDLFFKDPSCEENSQGYFESPALKRLRLKFHDRHNDFNLFERISKILAEKTQLDDGTEIESDELKPTINVPVHLQSEEYRKRTTPEEPDEPATDQTQLSNQKLYCIYNKKDGAASIGTLKSLPAEAKELERFYFRRKKAS